MRKHALLGAVALIAMVAASAPAFASEDQDLTRCSSSLGTVKIVEAESVGQDIVPPVDSVIAVMKDLITETGCFTVVGSGPTARDKALIAAGVLAPQSAKPSGTPDFVLSAGPEPDGSNPNDRVGAHIRNHAVSAVAIASFRRHDDSYKAQLVLTPVKSSRNDITANGYARKKGVKFGVTGGYKATVAVQAYRNAYASLVSQLNSSFSTAALP